MRKVTHVLEVEKKDLFNSNIYAAVAYDDGTLSLVDSVKLADLINEQDNNSVVFSQIDLEELGNKNRLLYDSINRYIDLDKSRKKERLRRNFRDYNLGEKLIDLYDYPSLVRENKNNELALLDQVLEKTQKLVFDECWRSGISFEEDKNEIIRSVLDTITDDREREFAKYGFENHLDFDFCANISSIYQRFNSDASKAKKDKDFERISENYKSRRVQMINYTYSFFEDYDNMLLALNNKNMVGREKKLQGWAEFLMVAKDYVMILDALEQCSEMANEEKLNYKMTRLFSNSQFINDVNSLLKHDTSNETYYFHATGSKKVCDNILENGLFMYSDDLSSTTYPELGLEGALSYEYGNGLTSFGDYLIVLRQKNGENIVRETTEVEKDMSVGIARRTGMDSIRCDYIVDSSNILGYIDKRKEKVVFNNKCVKEMGDNYEK